MSHTVSKGLTKSVIAFRISWNSDLPDFQAGRFVLVAKNPIELSSTAREKGPKPNCWLKDMKTRRLRDSWFKTSFCVQCQHVSVRARSACGIIAEEENRTSKTAPTQMLGGKYGIEWNWDTMHKQDPSGLLVGSCGFHALSAKAHELHHVLQHFRTLVCPRPESTSTVGLRFVSLGSKLDWFKLSPRMAQIPEQPEMERPKTSPAKDGSASQTLSTRGFKSMKTAGTVKFQNASGSGPLGAHLVWCVSWRWKRGNEVVLK